MNARVDANVHVDHIKDSVHGIGTSGYIRTHEWSVQTESAAAVCVGASLMHGRQRMVKKWCGHWRYNPAFFHCMHVM